MCEGEDAEHETRLLPLIDTLAACGDMNEAEAKLFRDAGEDGLRARDLLNGRGAEIDVTGEPSAEPPRRVGIGAATDRRLAQRGARSRTDLRSFSAPVSTRRERPPWLRRTCAAHEPNTRLPSRLLARTARRTRRKRLPAGSRANPAETRAAVDPFGRACIRTRRSDGEGRRRRPTCGRSSSRHAPGRVPGSGCRPSR